MFANTGLLFGTSFAMVFTAFDPLKTTLCCKQETAFTQDYLQCGNARRASSRVAGLFMF